MPRAPRTRRAAPGGRRVPPADRRRQLLGVAARIVTERGLEQLQFTELAARAGVSRPLVYRMFPTRHALVQAMLEEFTAHLGAAFGEAVVRALPSTIEGVAAAFVEASCDTIEAKGAGPWRLLGGGGGDPELARLGHVTMQALVEPWGARLAELTGRNARRNANVLGILVAAGRAALDGWIEGRLSRREAVEDGTRTVVALLAAFGADPKSPPS